VHWVKKSKSKPFTSHPAALYALRFTLETHGGRLRVNCSRTPQVCVPLLTATDKATVARLRGINQLSQSASLLVILADRSGAIECTGAFKEVSRVQRDPTQTTHLPKHASENAVCPSNPYCFRCPCEKTSLARKVGMMNR
jgi:hypothetical protein